MSAEAGTLLLSAIARRFGASGVRVAMLRGDGSPPDLRAGDVDLLVHPADLVTAVRALAEAAAESGWRRLFEERLANHWQVVLWRPGGRDREPASAHFDFQDALGRRGLRYARAEPFLAATSEGGWLPALQPAPRSLALALHTLLDRAHVREEQRSLLSSVPRDELERFAKGILPRRAASLVTSWVSEGAPDAAIASTAKRVRRSLRRANPASFLSTVAVRFGRPLRLVGRRRGVLVAFLGPDGAGKTSLAEAVARSIPRGPYPVRTVYLGKRETFLPTSRLIRRLYAERQDASVSLVTRPPSWKSRAKDVAGLANWYAEQWARYWFHVRPILQQGGVVLADRYAFDVAYRDAASLAHSARFRRLLPRSFPRPDRTYLLWDEPEVLHRRKPELSPDEARVLLDRLRAIVAEVPGSRELRTDRPLDETAREITQDVSALLERRCR